MKFNDVSKEEANMRLNEFLNSGMSYTEQQLKFIHNNFYSSDSYFNQSYLLLEIYAHLGLLNDKENLYLNFAKRVLQKYGKNVNIADIACGCYPIFSEYIRDMNENKSIIIDAYDPLLAIKNMNRITLHEEDFSVITNVKRSDLLVGIIPCEATKTIIEKAILDDKEFYIAMCGCVHLSFEEMVMTPFGCNSIYGYYVDSIYSLASTAKNRGYDVTLEHVYDFAFPYPVISSKRKILDKSVKPE